MKNKILWIVGGVVVVILLAGAAFLGVRMLNAKNGTAKGPITGGGPGAGGEMSLTTKNGSGSNSSVSIKMTQAPELPVTSADLVGMVNAINGNSLTVTQGGMMTVSKVGENSTPVVSTPENNNTGPATEVVLTKDTKIWRDTTMDNAPKPSAGQSELVMQQTVETADASSIVAGYPIQVWGQKRGDRLVAEVVVVTAPVVMGGGKAP